MAASEWKIRQYVPDSDEDDEEDSLLEIQVTKVSGTKTNEDSELLQAVPENPSRAREGSQDNPLEQNGSRPLRIHSDESCESTAYAYPSSGSQGVATKEISATVSNHELNTTDQLTDHDGLELSQLPEQLFIGSPVSSALSSISASPASLSPVTPVQTDVEVPQDPPSLSLDDIPARLEQPQDTPSLSIDNIPARLEEQQSYLPDRRFRQRKAIQINPYAIEGQAYKQACKSRGLVPVQVKNATQQEPERDNGSASSDYEEDSQPIEQSRLGYEESLEQAQRPAIGSVEDDFPNLQQILRSPLANAAIQGSKRRKLAHTYSRHDQKIDPSQPKKTAFPVRADGWIEVPLASNRAPSRPQTSHGPVSSGTVVSTPVTKTPLKHTIHRSPARGSSTHTNSSPNAVFDNFQEFNIGYTATPPQLQTPITSSETRQSLRDKRTSPGPTPRRRLIRHPAVATTPDSNDDDNTSTAESSVDEEAIRREVARAQKRTRGVLPASWHKLQLEQLLQKGTQVTQRVVQSSNRRRRSFTSPIKEARKGVARPIIRPRPDPSDTPNRAAYVTISDDDTDEDDDNPAARPPNQVQQQMDDYITTNDHFFNYNDEDESDMEDNSIDRMVAGGGSRHRKRLNFNKSPAKKKQPKIRDVLPRHSTTYAAGRSLPQGAPTRKPQARRKTANPKQTRLGILDATRGMTRAQTPNFLALANRTARNRTDRGRSYPIRKHIRLQNAKETEDAQQSLDAWQKGKLRPKLSRTYSKPQRNPLQERSANHSRPQFFLSDPDDDVEMDHPAATIARPTLSGIDHKYSHVMSMASTFKSATTLLHPKNKQFSKQGHPVLSALRSAAQPAPAQLENEQLRRRDVQAQEDDIVLERFLNGNETLTINLPKKSGYRRRQQSIKHAPRQVTIASSEEADEGIVLIESEPEIIAQKPQASQVDNDSGLLHGLLPLGVEYSISFLIARLPDGLHFNATGLLGSGLFHQSLSTKEDHGSLGPLHTTLAGAGIMWDGWDQAVADQIFQFSDKAIASIETLQDSVADPAILLRTIIRYFARHIRFLDPIDRKDFVLRWLHVLHAYNDDLQRALSLGNSTTNLALAEVACCFAVICNQIQQIADHDLVDRSIRKSVSEITESILERSLEATFQHGLEDFRMFSKNASKLSRHLTNSNSTRRTEILVIITHLLRQPKENGSSLWHVLRNHAHLVPPVHATVPTLDRVWKHIFILLPIIEIDSSGRTSKDVLWQGDLQNWPLARQLIEPVLQAYSKLSVHSTKNQYIRALYARCFQLVDYWNWKDCESILGFLFDFFARNELHDLQLENSHGSPKFLDNLTSTTALGLTQADKCFHILLKIIGKGLRMMRTIHPEKKIGNCIFRLTPNHGRSLPKEEAVRHEDLDAVRNHFDLLVVLYWAAPPAYRVRVEVIRRLINIESSHREACQLVINTWSRLVQFQLSTQESTAKLAPFIQWFDEIISKAIKLHRLARDEVEKHAQLVFTKFGKRVSKDQQERTILESQRHVEAILLDALLALKKAVLKADNPANLQQLLPVSVLAILELFEINSPRTTSIVVELIHVIRSWTQRAQQLDNGDDSQGFGDYDLNDLESTNHAPAILTLPKTMVKPLHGFMSSIFGADAMVDDPLLHELVELWLDIAALETKSGNASWSEFIDEYEPRAWMAFRLTTQTRKFTPFLLARLLKMSGDFYEKNRSVLLQYWVDGLVERHSLIKYEPELTLALFDQDSQEPLFQNPPFSKDNGSYKINIGNFLEQRVALISCLFSNMRESLSFMEYYILSEKDRRKQEYADLLRHMMAKMKNNYQSLSQESEGQGDYVVFTQRVVQLLREHTLEFCKIDSFFLDAVNFPLPVEDPEYLVAHLKSLVLQLDTERGQKELVAFLQGICERAVTENQQDHFAGLLDRAMQDAFEAGIDERVTLRSFICCYMVPIYMEYIPRTPCGWLVARVLLLALPSTFQSFLLHVDTFNEASIASANAIVNATLNSISQSISQILQQETPFAVSNLMTLTLFLQILEAMLDVVDYLCRRDPKQQYQLTDVVLCFFNVGLLLSELSNSSEFDQALLDLFDGLNIPNSMDLHKFTTARTILKDMLDKTLMPKSLQCKWRLENGKVLVHRMSRWESIVMNFSGIDQLKGDLKSAALRLLGKISTTPSFAWMGRQIGILEAGDGANTRVAMEVEHGDDEFDAFDLY